MENIAHLRQGLPSEMQILLRDYPREIWPGHPNFAASIQNWMGAHVMFRRLASQAQTQAEAYLQGDLDADGFAERFGYFGDLLVRNLHGHHTWEDRKFFPELSSADDRFDAGLEMLESDHIEMDQLLDSFTRQGNRAVMLAHLDPDQAYEAAAQLLPQAAAIKGFLHRHLTDEEELVVPILLHHKLRG
jgi:hypothetical protein